MTLDLQLYSWATAFLVFKPQPAGLCYGGPRTLTDVRLRRFAYSYEGQGRLEVPSVVI